MNIKITKSSYKTKDNRRAIIFDCSTKNYRKKINTRVLVDDNYFENPNIPIKISLKITIEKIEEKKRNALEKYLKNDWSFKELENYLKKGSQVYIEGKIQTRSYEQEGITKYSTEIVGRELTMLGRKGDNQGDSAGGFAGNTYAGNSAVPQQQQKASAPVAPDFPMGDDDEDDLPF